MIQSAMHKQWGRLAMAVAGACIYAVGINLFVVPAGLITGGMVGFCQLLRSAILGILGIKYLSFDLSGIIYYALNIPLLIIAYRSLGHRFFRNTSGEGSRCRFLGSISSVLQRHGLSISLKTTVTD